MIDPKTVVISGISVRDHSLISFVQPHGMASRYIALPCSVLEFFEGHIVEAFTRAYEHSSGCVLEGDYIYDYGAILDALSTRLKR